MRAIPPMNPAPVIVIGGGPAGLMAAETARAAGCPVELYDHMGSVGRKILIAGKGGLNLTHSEDSAGFRARYGERAAEVARWLDHFDADAVRDWAAGLGVTTVVGSSGRVFPADFKAAPLLRGWVRRLRRQGVVFHLNQRWTGWDDQGRLCFDGPDGQQQVPAAATVLALGGGSWAKLGSDGLWTGLLAGRGIEIVPLAPSNCGFEVAWSEHFRQRHAGQPLKAIAAAARPGDFQRGEFLITDYGVEGGLIYALSAALRAALAQSTPATLWLDLYPERDQAELARSLARPRGRRSFGEHLRRSIGLQGQRAGLLHEACPEARNLSPEALAQQLKSLPIRLTATRPIDEAISTAGGVRLEALTEQLMLKAMPGVFCAGEMLDWDAPTGGYLLTACFASGKVAGQGAAEWALTPAV
jgi:uncharacterized flavoprotein (TIGR03862 family)